MPETTTIFVYGTLKRGGHNHRLLAGQQFLGEVTTAPAYRVIDLGPHPGMLRDASSGLAVAGELWAVSASALAALDDFEEVPGPFVREEIAIPDRPGPVFAYLWNRPVPAGAATGDCWPLAK